MARAATTTDAFNAIAEPRRRQILDAIGGGQLSVNELVAILDIPQPLVSGHLRVLREVGIVTARQDGRQRLYRLDGRALKPVYDWVKDFQQLWSERFARMDIVLAELKELEDGDGSEDDGQVGRGDASE